MSVLEPAISPVQDLASRAGELTYRLRRGHEDLLAHIAAELDVYHEFKKLQDQLQNENVIYTAELPHFLLQTFERYREYIEEQSKPADPRAVSGPVGGPAGTP